MELVDPHIWFSSCVVQICIPNLATPFRSHVDMSKSIVFFFIYGNIYRNCANPQARGLFVAQFADQLLVVFPRVRII